MTRIRVNVEVEPTELDVPSLTVSWAPGRKGTGRNPGLSDPVNLVPPESTSGDLSKTLTVLSPKFRDPPPSTSF